MLAPRGLYAPGSGAERIGYAVWVLCWLIGHVAGGGLLGALLGWLGHVLPEWRTAVLVLTAAVCLAYGLGHVALLRLPLPNLPRQVPRGWMCALPWNVVALGYGFQLGCAVATRITIASVYPVLALAFVLGSPVQGALILGVFGLARAILPAVVGPWVDSPGKSFYFATRFDMLGDRVSRLNGVLLLAALVVVAAAVWETGH